MRLSAYVVVFASCANNIDPADLSPTCSPAIGLRHFSASRRLAAISSSAMRLVDLIGAESLLFLTFMFCVGVVVLGLFSAKM